MLRNAGLVLGQRQRRWTNINPALGNKNICLRWNIGWLSSDKSNYATLS